MSDFFDAKLNRGDVEGAINQALLGCDQAKEIAEQAIASLENKREQVKEIAAAVLDKYPLL